MKYRNHRVVVFGETFDSKAEAQRWLDLRLLERAGKVGAIQRQVRFELAPAVKFEGSARAKPALTYTADFVYAENGRTVVEDVKSEPTMTAAFQIKRHLMKSIHGIDIRLVK